MKQIDALQPILDEYGVTIDELIQSWDNGHSWLTPDGKEIPDPKPLVLHGEGPKKLTIEERVSRMVTQHLSELADQENYDTYEEFLDMEIPEEDAAPMSTYQQMEEDYAQQSRMEDLSRRDEADQQTQPTQQGQEAPEQLHNEPSNDGAPSAQDAEGTPPSSIE